MRTRDELVAELGDALRETEQYPGAAGMARYGLRVMQIHGDLVRWLVDTVVVAPVDPAAVDGNGCLTPCPSPLRAHTAGAWRGGNDSDGCLTPGPSPQGEGSTAPERDVVWQAKRMALELILREMELGEEREGIVRRRVEAGHRRYGDADLDATQERVEEIADLIGYGVFQVLRDGRLSDDECVFLSSVEEMWDVLEMCTRQQRRAEETAVAAQEADGDAAQ